MQESAKELKCSKTPEISCTPKQEEAIRHADGPAMVLAGPGSGKTFVTVHRIRRLITSQGVDPAHILVITFTKAAALEMQQRFFRLMGEENLPVRFGTFHAVFYYILKRSAQYRNYTIITETEKRKLIRDITRNHKRFVYLQEEDIEEIITAVSRHKIRAAEAEMKLAEGEYSAGRTKKPGVAAEHKIEESSAKSRVTRNGQKDKKLEEMLDFQKMKWEDFQFLYKEYQDWLAEISKFDFDDLMTACLRLLREDKETLSMWQAKFRYILVDEFQDISPIQYEIIRLLAAPKNNLFVVGDDDQSIYGFRGASPDCMKRFLADFAQAEQILLNVNFRCHRDIVEAAANVIGENKSRIPKEIFSAHKEGAGLRLCRAASEETLRKTVTDMLVEEQRTGTLAQCAMICRTNLECGFWAQALHEAGIPYMMREKPKNRFSHFVIQDICAYLALGQGDCARKHFLHVMNRPVRYMKRDSLPETKVEWEALTGYYADTPLIQARVRKLYRDIDSLAGKRVHLQIHYIRKVIGYEGFLREKYGSEKAEELIRIGEEFEAFSRQFSTVREMRTYMEHYAETITDPERNAEGLQLMTMHASKGLEFQKVFVPECNEGKIPSDKSKTIVEIEEERRMFYVAMTRAKNKLCLVYHEGKTGKDMPSRFLTPLLSDFYGSSTISSNSAASRNSSKASATASYSSSSSM